MAAVMPVYGPSFLSTGKGVTHSFPGQIQLQVCVGGGGEMREREMGLEDGRKKGCEGERERGEMGKRGEAGRRGEEGEEEKGGNGGRERG